MSKKKTAIINSRSFGEYFPEQIERLEAVGEVSFYRDLDPNIGGKELAEKLKDYDYLIPSVTPNFTREFFDNAPNLKMIARHGLGFNNVDIDAATDHGVYVTKIVGEYERDTVAELSVSFITSLIRHVVPADQALKTDQWEKKADFFGTELHALTLGVIGLGNIGSRVSEIVHNGYGTKVIAYDPNVSAEKMKEHGAIKVELDELLETSDVISLNAAVTDSSYQMLRTEQFKKMKPGVMIANTARGDLLVEEELADAIREGHVKSYASDVFVTEPIPADNPLKDFEYNILTPHIGAYTDLSLKAMGDKVVRDVELMANGEKPEVIINEEVVGR